jgi:hypothetical protein
VWRRVGLVVSAALLLASCGSGGGGAAPGQLADEQAEAPRSEDHEHHHEHGADGGSAADPGASGPAAPPDCPERGHGPRPEAPPVRPAEITQASQRALRALARESERLPCGAIAEWASHVHNHAHGVAPPERALAGPEADAFSRQWAAAVAASGGLATPEQAAAAGYAQSSSQVPGVGTHWINWTLVDAPFDPARPSMLLFDETPGRRAHLVGFSYWVRSGSEPEGFAGANDGWHSHLGLCFVRGRLYLEGVPAALACPGTWLNGGDLWMLHAWVVPNLPNSDGRFAPAHPAVR